MANRRFIDFPIAASVGNNDIVLIWQDGLNKQTTKATLLQGSPQSLAGLTDVDIAGLINGQILQYNSTTSKWENVDRTDINLSQLGDVTIVAPANGQVLVYNSSTGKWENSSAGYVPYTGAVTTVNLGAQSILAGSFVKAGGTAAQFLKANGSVDSTAYGTGTVTSVALTMPSAFSVGGSPITTAGTLAVTATGTTAQYIRGDGSLETFPALTGFVPYTGATADVNLGTHDLLAERGTFANNGSSDTLTVNHTSGSGYGIIVTKGGNNEALYVSKTSGSGNAMTVVGGRTSLVDLALSSVTNTAGDFLTLSGGVVHKRTAAQTLTDIGGQAALTNPVTGTGTTNYLSKFTGASTIGNSIVYDDGAVGIGTLSATAINNASGIANLVVGNGGASPQGITIYTNSSTYGGLNFADATTGGGAYAGYIKFDHANDSMGFFIGNNPRVTIFSDGNTFIGTSPSNAGFKLDVNGRGRFTAGAGQNGLVVNGVNSIFAQNVTAGTGTSTSFGMTISAGTNSSDIAFQIYNSAENAVRFFVRGDGNVGIGTASPSGRLHILDSAIFRGATDYVANTYEAVFSESSTGGSNVYPFNANGNLVIQPRTNTGAARDIVFATGSNTPSTRMIISSGGNVLIGTTTDQGYKCEIQTSSTNAALWVQTGGTTSAYTIADFRTGTNLPALQVLGNGTIVMGGLGTGSVTSTAGTLSTVSDMYYKIDDGFIDSAIEKVLSLKPRYFYWNEKSGLPKDIRQLGFYAQEVNEALGEEAANTPQDKNTPWGISDRSIIAMLTKAIQELKEEIDTLKN